MAADLKKKLDDIEAVQDTGPAEAIVGLRSIVLDDSPNDAESIKVKEQAIQKLADLHAKLKDAVSLRQLLTDLRPLFGVLPKAKTAKLVRTIIDAVAKVPGSTQVQVTVALIIQELLFVWWISAAGQLSCPQPFFD